MEQFFDGYASTLASSYTSGGTSISVTSAALPNGGSLPTSGLYTLTVRDATTAALKAIFLVTARSGTTLTTVAELDASCASGDIITGYTLSSRSLPAICSDFQERIQGGLYVRNPLEFTWSWLNQESNSVLAVGGGRAIYHWVPQNGSGHVTGQTTPLVGTSAYTATIGFRMLPAHPSTDYRYGIWLADVTGKSHMFLIRPFQDFLETMGYNTSFGYDGYENTSGMGNSYAIYRTMSHQFFLRIQEDPIGNTRKFFYGTSNDDVNGNWWEASGLATAAGYRITPTQVGFCGIGSSGFMAAVVNHFQITYP